MEALFPRGESPLLLSASMLKQWQRCKRQFYYKVVKQAHWLSQQGNFALGKEVHKLLDYQARGLEVGVFAATILPTSQALLDAFGEHPYSEPRRCLANEWAFNVPLSPERLPHVWLTGRIDRLVRGKQGGVIVVDWKTGTAIPKQPASDWQTRLYCYALQESRGQLGLEALTPEGITMAYVEAKAGRQRPLRIESVPYTTALHQETQDDLLQLAAAMVQERAFALPPACPDRHCPYGRICGIAPATTEQLSLLALPQTPILAAQAPAPAVEEGESVFDLF